MTGTRALTTSSASKGYAATNVFSLRGGRQLRQQPVAPPDLLSAVVARLEELIRLESGWDGYEGQPVGFGNAVFALRMFESISAVDTPAPAIVPGSSGDLQLEWHLPAGEIELHVRAPNVVHAWRFLAGAHPFEQELTLSTDFSEVAKWLHDLTEAPLAPHATAA